MSFNVGNLVKISGLKAKPELNGSLGVVVGTAPDSSDQTLVRNKVMLSKGNTTVSLKASNLAMAVFDETSPIHEVALFWPPTASDSSEAVKVAPIVGWPICWTLEDKFMKEKLQWSNPQILGGVEGPGDVKPNYMMYYDAGDDQSFVNHFATKIAAQLPAYEHQKVEKPCTGEYRGACIIVYSPMNTSPDYGSEAKKSLRDLRRIVEWHCTEAGNMTGMQYKAHDNPFHRVWGGVHPPGDSHPSCWP